MNRCLHQYESGWQCQGEAQDASDFCDAHQRVVAFERLEDSMFRRMFVPVIAFILVVILLGPVFSTLRHFVSVPRVAMRGAW